jgi:hypothetical protein
VSLANTDTVHASESGFDIFPIIVEVTGSTFNVYHEDKTTHEVTFNLDRGRIRRSLRLGLVSTLQGQSVLRDSRNLRRRFSRDGVRVVYRFSFPEFTFQELQDQMDSFENKTAGRPASGDDGECCFRS